MSGTLFTLGPGAEPRREIAPGAVHLSSWLTADQQRWMAERFREWAAGPVPIRAAKVRGPQMSVQTVCLGWHWQPYRYTREATDVNGLRVLPFPEWMVRLGRRAVAEAVGDVRAGDGYRPDAALINFYDQNARLGMHQDKDERSAGPVVSLSVGDSCTFRFGNTGDRSGPYQNVLLASGDLFVFGGPSRFAFHGVPRIHPGTAPAGCGVAAGRINITMRVTGLT